MEESKYNSEDIGSDTKRFIQPITHPSDSIKQFLNLVRNNFFPILLIFLASVFATVIYVTNAIDIYRTNSTIKITRPQGDILTAKFQAVRRF